ncbi:MAG TPA: sulfite exporter TauE/SafE family protein, partial [Halieaceae bacterium]|nr:sulfite exporter TauE/SafE family protein [Halieaceae bacterium]
VLAVMMFSVAGIVTQTPLLLLLLAFPLCVVGDQIGSRLFHRFGGT